MPIWSDDRFLAFDFETSGELPEYALQPWRVAQGKAWATSLVWCQKDSAGMRIEGGLDPTVADMRHMLEHAIETGRTICGWNVQFDIQWLLAHGLEDLVFRCRWLDGMLLWRHWFIEPEYETDRGKRKSYGLKTCVEEVLPQFAGYSEDVDFHDPSPEARTILHDYNIRDTMFTLRLTRHWYRQLQADSRRLKAALIESRIIPHVAKANLVGMPIDTVGTRELSQKLVDDAARLLEALGPHGVTEKIVRSPMQLGKLLFDDWKLPVLKENVGKKTGKVSRATDKETLHELAFVDPRAKQLREYREALNNRTKFAEAPLKSAAYNEDGRTRPAAITFGTYSGRLTYGSKQGRGKEERQTGFALHQMKREKVFRRGIAAPPGYTIVEFDAAGQEFRWMAVASGDETMLSLCMPGEDPHSYMGAQISNTNYKTLIQLVKADDKEAGYARQLGKVANLCVSGDTLVLTDRGVCPILQVTKRDRVWDGIEFVTHDGVVYSGVRPVLSYGGITATPDHKVLVRGEWVRLDEAARHGWTIEPALGAGEQSRAGQPATGDTRGEFGRPRPVYDIVNCGPRRRFAANGVIVHNSLQYRTSAAKLRVVARVQYNLPMELPEAQLIHRTYQHTYQKVPEYWAKQISMVKRLGYVETFAGRQVQVVGNWVGRSAWSMGSTAINYRIQGTGAEQKYLAVMCLEPLVRELGAMFAWDLHDGIYWFVPDAKAEKFAVEGKRILDNLPYRRAWGFTPPVPMPFDCKMGPTWGTLKDFAA